MTKNLPPGGRLTGAAPLLLAVAALLSVLGPGARLSTAPDDEEVAGDAAADAVNQQAAGVFLMAPQQIDNWLFQTAGGEEQARARLESQLTLQIQEFGGCCELTAAQEEKLRLAAALDTKQFFAEVEVVRRHFQAMKQDQNAVQEIWQEVSPLRERFMAGLYGERSLFEKVARTILAPNQAAKRQELIRDRRRFRYRATIEATLVEMEESQVVLTAEQHAALVALLLKESKPPLTTGQYETQVVQAAIARMPEAKLKPLFGERAWKRFDRSRQAFGRWEQILIQQGVIEADEGENTE